MVQWFLANGYKAFLASGILVVAIHLKVAFIILHSCEVYNASWRWVMYLSKCTIRGIDCPRSDDFSSCFVIQDSAIPEMDLASAADDVNAALFETWHPDDEALDFIGHHSFDLNWVAQKRCFDNCLSPYGQ